MTLAAMLGANYSEAWPSTLPVIAEFLRCLGPRAGPLIPPLVSALASLCRGAADAAETANLAQSTLGVAISTQGPESVLNVVPITGLERSAAGAADLADSETWLLPLLRKYVVGSKLALWGHYILPLARSVGQLSVAANASGTSHLVNVFSKLCVPINMVLYIPNILFLVDLTNESATKQIQVTKACRFLSVRDRNLQESNLSTGYRKVKRFHLVYVLGKPC